MRILSNMETIHIETTAITIGNCKIEQVCNVENIPPDYNASEYHVYEYVHRSQYESKPSRYEKRAVFFNGKDAIRYVHDTLLELGKTQVTGEVIANTVPV